MGKGSDMGTRWDEAVTAAERAMHDYIENTVMGAANDALRQNREMPVRTDWRAMVETMLLAAARAYAGTPLSVAELGNRELPKNNGSIPRELAKGWRIVPEEPTREMVMGARGEDFTHWDGELSKGHYEALYRAMLESAPSTAPSPAELAKGWRLVPEKPTPDMVIAGGIAWSDAESTAETYVDNANACYCAMLAAAPSPPLAGDGVVKTLNKDYRNRN